MKLMKKVVVVFLAVCMLLLTGCGGNAANDKKRTSATKKESKNWETVDAYSEDKVVDLKGYEFTIASPYLKDDDSGTTAQDIVFRAAVDAVEAQYNCKIKVINLVCDLPNLQVKIMSGDKVADLLDINPASLVGGINAGYIRPMESIKGIDYNDKRWVKGYTQIGMLKDKHYGLNFMRPAEVRWCMFYN